MDDQYDTEDTQRWPNAVTPRPAAQHTPGPWKTARDTGWGAQPWIAYRVVGTGTIEALRHATGIVRTFRTRAEARAALAQSTHPQEARS